MHVSYIVSQSKEVIDWYIFHCKKVEITVQFSSVNETIQLAYVTTFEC